MKDYFEVTHDDVDNAYKAGQQSHQAKIDELQARIDGARSHVDHIFNVLGDDPDLAKLLDEMVEILKGNKDEN